MAVWSHGVYSIDFYQPEKFSPNEAFKIDETRRVSSMSAYCSSSRLIYFPKKN